MFTVSELDHLVLTVRSIPATVAFYTRVMGMQAILFGEGRQALRFGNQKINLHQAGSEFQPCAAAPTSGSADLCFLTETPLNDVIAHLKAEQIPIIESRVERTGATHRLLSVYFRDPDSNLIEVSNRLP